MKKEKDGFKLQYNKQSVEVILIQRAVKMTIQVLYDESLFDAFPNANKVPQDFFLHCKEKT